MESKILENRIIDAKEGAWRKFYYYLLFEYWVWRHGTIYLGEGAVIRGFRVYPWEVEWFQLAQLISSEVKRVENARRNGAINALKKEIKLPK